MHGDFQSEKQAEPDAAETESFGAFQAVPKGDWAGVSDTDWNDWHWQLRHRISTPEQLERILPGLTPEEREGVRSARRRFSFAVTPYFFNLIRREDVDCPIRRQVIPRIEETRRAPWETDDPCGEDAHSPVPGLVHRYPDRVLLLVTDRCAAYCRYCTRSRLVGRSGDHWSGGFALQLDYIRRTPAVRDVLLSGGDPLLLGDDKLDALLSALRAIPHVEFLRIGTRAPVFLPQRITPELCGMLKKHHPLFVSIHSNHPRELTAEARGALERLADAGIPLGNQSVLLHGVNDSPAVMLAHVRKLLRCRVRPYYLYQCDLIAGSAHFRVGVRRGLEIMEGLRGHTTGYAVPQYVIDVPGGGGKVPVNPESVLSRNPGRLVLRNFEGKIFEYPGDHKPASVATTDGEPNGAPLPADAAGQDAPCR